MIAKLDVGATLREVFDTYRDQAGVLLPVAFWLYLAVAIVGALVAGNLALFPIELVVAVIAATLYQGMVVDLVADVQDGRRDSSVRELMNSVVPVLGTLIGAGILSGIGIGVGFVFLIVPGLYLATIWAVIAPAIVVERHGVFDAFGRSRQLVKGNGWGVFLTILVAFLIASVAAVVLGAIGNAIATGLLVRIVFSALASTLTAPITALVAAVLFFRLRTIQGAAAPAEEPPSPPPSVLQ